MRVLTMIVAAVAVGLGPTALADSYKDLAAQGYRWVTVDGPYACPSKEDLRELSRHHTDLAELTMIQDLRTYYLIRGAIVQVVQQDAAAGMSQIHVPGHPMTVWTLTRFLSRKPIPDTLGIVETPTTSNMMPKEQMGHPDASPDTTATSSPTPQADAGAGAAKQQGATATPAQ
jgi:hypothetical protein